LGGKAGMDTTNKDSDQRAATSPPDQEWLTGLPLVLATLGVSLAAFMNVLDSTIAVVALPAISGSLSATPSQGSWVLTIYGVCLAASLPLAGWVGARFGQVRAFVWSIAVFTAFSWLCAAAQTFDQLLVARAFQGLSGGMLLPLSQSLVMRLYPPEKQGMALGFWGLSAGVAPVAGPVLGGYITDNFGWPWIFYINIPVGIVSIGICLALLRSRETSTVKVPVDLVGLVLMLVGVICLQLGLDRGHELDWFASREVQALFFVGATSLIFFIIWELDEAHPIVDLSLFRQRNFALGALMTAMFYCAFVVSSVIYPLWMQTVLGYTPGGSGWVMATTSLFPLLSMGLIGQWLRNQNPRMIIILGCLMMAPVIMAHGLMTIQVSATYLTSIRFLIGFAMPFLWIPLMMVTLGGVPPEKLATATGISNFMRMLASSLATAGGITLWDDRSVVHRADIIAGLSEPSIERQHMMSMLGESSGDPSAGLMLLDTLVTQQARTMAQQDVYTVGAGIIVLMIFMVGMLPRRLPSSAPENVPTHD